MSPEISNLLYEALHGWPQFEVHADAPDSAREISGADMVEWFSDWRERMLFALAKQS